MNDHSGVVGVFDCQGADWWQLERRILSTTRIQVQSLASLGLKISTIGWRMQMINGYLDEMILTS